MILMRKPGFHLFSSGNDAPFPVSAWPGEKRPAWAALRTDGRDGSKKRLRPQRKKAAMFPPDGHGGFPRLPERKFMFSWRILIHCY